MLLLFWKALGLNVGNPAELKWYHAGDAAPRCLISGELGLSVVNPYLLHESTECTYALINKQCTSADVYDGDIILGTQEDGLFKLPWSTVKNADCLVDAPVDLAASVETFTTFSGLLSQNIISVEANHDYLSIVTSSGLSFGRATDGAFICFLSTSGTDSYVTQEGTVFFAEGARVLRKGNVSDFGSWDYQYQLGSVVNDIWVTEKDGINTLFVATASGLAVFEKGQEFHYGTSNYSQIKAEVGTTINQGHIFAVSDRVVDVINLRNKTLENSIDYDEGSVSLLVENRRLYSK